MSVTEADVRAALARVVDPSGGADVVSSGMLGAVSISGGEVRVVLEVDPAKGRAMEPVARAAEAAIAALPGVTRASAMLTAHSDSPSAPPPNLRGTGHGHAHGHSHGPAGGPGEPLRQAAKPQSGPIEGVDRILAIGSGKGGVGKSTVSANLAVALAAEGRRVGLLDADVYGPSQPRMLGISGRPSSPDGQTILPLRNHGVTLMSIGLLTPEDKATIWRGPMLMGALQQMLRQVAWGRLDVLIVDLPPGTGDVQLTLSQKAEVTGAVVVSTPQDIALLDAKKALDMFEKTGTKVVGMIENMSTFVCPCCGEETQIFGHGGAKAEAERIGAPFLGEIPLDIDVRLSGDAGVPVVAAKPQSPQALRFREIARKLIGAGYA
ncbi:Mrp/NBP35 family ATP-binding protein [Paroceanicella profunda]|uniref:Iron-sulfur cluster carrier protein n=1 Tax=Paroceanicella profunda TaxID=2579971 RepID=A0A5B8FHI1_9RHOB|nr:Mrp/NBP35 family ATP-binding protein [Paroceanicella profunda]QDL92441.1 Mrp/NBP35 family ATP-binding protein [Paroceanicella profunda]